MNPRTAAAAALLVVAPAATADILLHLSPAPGGGTLLEITGTYDVTGGSNFGGTAGNIHQFSSAYDFAAVQASRVAGLAASSTGILLPNPANTDNPVNADVTVANPGFTFDNLVLTVAGNDILANYIFVFESGPLSGSLNESVVMPTVDFAATFNEGIWDAGEFGGTANDAIRLQIVPAPASAATLGLGGLMITRRRR